jgi:hypothetical protein
MGYDPGQGSRKSLVGDFVDFGLVRQEYLWLSIMHRLSAHLT